MDWAKVAPVIHEVKDDHEAYAISMAISKQMGKITVRVCDIHDRNYFTTEGPPKKITAAYVARCNGKYFQAK